MTQHINGTGSKCFADLEEVAHVQGSVAEFNLIDKGLNLSEPESKLGLGHTAP
jgi:hypothetical protein